MPPKRTAPQASSSKQRRRVEHRAQPAEEVELASGDAEADEGEDEDEDEREYEQAGETQGGTGGKGLSTEEVKRCAAKLVRLALFYEYQRKVLKREVISKEVLPHAKSSFPIVFARAQTVLRQTFGMELYELRKKSHGAAAAGLESQATQAQTQTQMQKKGKGKGRGGRSEVVEEEDDEEEDDEQEDEGEGEVGQGTQGVKKAPGSRTYILRSILPPELLELMAAARPLPLFDDPPNAQGYGDANDHVDSGALIPWEKADGTAAGHVALLGIRTIILCLVMCTGRVISDDHLHALLKRLNLLRETILPFASPDSKDPHLTLDKYLDLLAKQQYLEKVKVPGPPGTEATIEWRWGNREAEFTEAAGGAFIEKVFFDDAESSDDEDEEEAPGQNRRSTRNNGDAAPRRNRAAERQKRREKLRKDVVQAVGGPLLGQI